MNIEKVFRIYHKLQQGPQDYCDKIIITRDPIADQQADPTAVTVKFMQKKKRQLTANEKTILKKFGIYHKLGYCITEDGSMIWHQESMINLGKREPGKM
jgi:hypothetical protein